MMCVTPVRALNSIKISGIGGVANNPVVVWILSNGLADSTLGKRRTFLAEDFQLRSSTRNSTPLLASYLVIVCNPDYAEADGRDDTEDDSDYDWGKEWCLTCLYNSITRSFHEGAIAVVLRSIHVATVIGDCLACLYNIIENMFREGAINVILRSIHVAVVIKSSCWRRERKRVKSDSQVTN